MLQCPTNYVYTTSNFCVITNAVLRYAILTVIKIRYLYWKWADHHTFAQYVQNTSPGNIAQRDTIKIYTTALREIVRLIDYLAGRSSGQYMPDNPFWYKRNNPYHNIGSATIADSIGNTFKPRYVPQQAPLGISQYSASPIYPPMRIKNYQSYGTSLPQDAISKIEELNDW